MTTYDNLQARAYMSAEVSARGKLNNWQGVVIKLRAKGYTEREIKHYRKELELQAKGVFK